MEESLNTDPLSPSDSKNPGTEAAGFFAVLTTVLTAAVAAILLIGGVVVLVCGGAVVGGILGWWLGGTYGSIDRWHDITGWFFGMVAGGIFGFVVWLIACNAVLRSLFRGL